MCIPESLCCTAAINNIVNQLYFNKKNKFTKRTKETTHGLVISKEKSLRRHSWTRRRERKKRL